VAAHGAAKYERVKWLKRAYDSEKSPFRSVEYAPRA
jgi:hypothetical protein